MRKLLLILACLLTAGTARAEDPSALCESAIAGAEYTGSLPAGMLHAIAMVESGRYDETKKAVRPWPWTINAQGVGHYYTSKADAIGAVRDLQMHGIKSIDVGCAQVNLMFHPDAFASLDEAFDPIANAVYAAKFLNRLRAPGDDWAKAIAAYHSATPALGDAYRVMVMTRWSGSHPTVMAKVQPAAYRDFRATSAVYGAFAQASHAYGAQAYGSFARAVR